MIDKIVEECIPKMKAAIAVLETELSRIRTGRANASLTDGIFVSYYGTNTPLREVASITVPESSMIAIKPWDRNLLSVIETAIRNSDLGLSPVNDGVQIRLSLPPMTEDRRKEIVLQVKKNCESTKVSIRNIRGEAWGRVQAGLKNKEITEDDKYQAEEKLNKLVLDMNKDVDKITADKETEIMKI